MARHVSPARAARLGLRRTACMPDGHPSEVVQRSKELPASLSGLRMENPRDYGMALATVSAGVAWWEALRLLAALRSWQPPADLVNYTLAMGACARGAGWQAALALLHTARAEGMELDAMSICAAMAACSRGWKWRAALVLLGQMEIMRLVAGVVAHSIAMAACEKVARWKAALALLVPAVVLRRRRRARAGRLMRSAAARPSAPARKPSAGSKRCSFWQGVLSSWLARCTNIRTSPRFHSSGYFHEDEEEGWPSIPSLDDHGLGDAAGLLKKQSQEFEDNDISLEAAGFVGHDGLTMLAARWPGQLLCLLLTICFAVITVAYSTRVLDTGLDPDGPLLALMVSAYAIPAAAGSVALHLAMRGHPRMAVTVAGWAMVMFGLICLGAWMIPAIMQSKVAVAVECGVKGSVGLDIGLTAIFDEEAWMIMALRVSLVLYAAIAVLVWGFWYLYILHLLPPATIIFVLTVYLLLRRKWSLREAALAMKEDERRYNEAWIPAAAEKKEALARLTELVSKVKNERVLQPFDSLGAVYKRAAVLSPWYQAVVEHWATVCGVKFHAAPIKAQKRAMEKIHRSYDGDFRRVLDILRSTIVVDDLADVVRVFRMVLKQAHIHQVKNRFDPDFDSTQTAGYRDLNCQLTFRQLDHTEFEGFVFELQIHYTGILALKSNEGHKRYIKLRNLRGD